MLNYFTPIVMYCAIITGDISTQCNGANKFFSETLDPVSTPIQCLIEGSVRAMQFVEEWKKDHPQKPIEYRVKCDFQAKKI